MIKPRFLKNNDIIEIILIDEAHSNEELFGIIISFYEQDSLVKRTLPVKQLFNLLVTYE